MNEGLCIVNRLIINNIKKYITNKYVSDSKFN